MKIKLLTSKFIPKKAKPGDAGFDLYAPYDFSLAPGSQHQVKLGISIEISEDEVAIVQSRSGLSISGGLTTIGNVIDSGYRGEISAILLNLGHQHLTFKVGDRIAQLLILQLGNQGCEVVNELSETERGKSGWGSTGK